MSEILLNELYPEIQKCSSCNEKLKMDYFKRKKNGYYEKTCLSCYINKQKNYTNNIEPLLYNKVINNDPIPDYIIDNKGAKVNYVVDMFGHIWTLEKAIRYGLLKIHKKD